jgi:hypothetical protein
MSNLFRKNEEGFMPLQSSMVEKPFVQWGLDVIGPINPKSSKGHSYIVTTTDYFTKWKEATTLRNADSDHLIHFLKENILSRFGVPEKFITDNGSIFVGSKFTNFCGEYGIIMGQSSNYYPQGNGMAKSTNKTLIQIIKKTIEANHKNWHNKLIDALWASRLTPKKGTGHSPFTLVYGKEARLPLHMELNALALVVNDEDEEQSPMQRRHNELLQLEEQREQAVLAMKKRQETIKKYFDKSTTAKEFQKDQLVFLWNKEKENPSSHTKFEALWIDPYQIERINGRNSYILKDMNGTIQSFPVNGKYLKHFFC